MPSHPQCSQHGCSRPCAEKPNGGHYRSCAPCKARRAAWQRRHETKRTGAGNCRSCNAPCDRKPDGSHYTRCSTCRSERSQRTAKLKQEGLCGCGKPRDARADGSLYSRCPACRQQRQAHKRKLVAEGGCRMCYYRPRIEGNTVCESCLPIVLERDARRRAREAERDAKLKALEDERAEREAAKKAAMLPDNLRCTEKGCQRPRGTKADGSLYTTCDPCRERHNRNQRRRSAELRDEGGCSKCAYRPRIEGDTLCEQCREQADAKADIRMLANAIDEWAAKEEPELEPSAEDCGVSRWNSRKPRETGTGYWSPNPDPHRELDPDANTYSRFRRC